MISTPRYPLCIYKEKINIETLVVFLKSFEMIIMGPQGLTSQPWSTGFLRAETFLACHLCNLLIPNMNSFACHTKEKITTSHINCFQWETVIDWTVITEEKARHFGPWEGTPLEWGTQALTWVHFYFKDVRPSLTLTFTKIKSFSLQNFHKKK